MSIYAATQANPAYLAAALGVLAAGLVVMAVHAAFEEEWRWPRRVWRYWISLRQLRRASAQIRR